MMRITTSPKRAFQARPTFWNLDDEIKEALDCIDDTWGGTREITGVDFKESKHAYLVSIDIPGVSKKNLEIKIEGDYALIKGTKKSISLDNTGDAREVSKTIYIPKEVKKEDIQAHCEDGVLYLALPKVEKEKPININITNSFEEEIWNNFLNNKDNNSEDQSKK